MVWIFKSWFFTFSYQTYQRIRANRQRRLKLRTRKRHHTVESMLGYDLEDERREERPREARTYDAEDEPVDVEGDSLGWPDAAINIDGSILLLLNAVIYLSIII